MSARARLRLASTVVLTRAGQEGLEVLLLQRHPDSAFLPGAWVFPGGAVDPGDGEAVPGLTGGDAALARVGMASLDRRLLVGGLRETLEESGVWLGEGCVPRDARRSLAAGEASLSEVVTAHGLRADLDLFVPWSRWVTPEGAPRRFDTVFLLAELPEGARVEHDRQETVAARWVRPEDALDLGPRELPLAPPTWWTLKELRGVSGLAALKGRARDLSPAWMDVSDVHPTQGMAIRGPAPQTPIRLRWTDDGWRCTRAPIRGGG